jgi:hypothetical protein
MIEEGVNFALPAGCGEIDVGFLQHGRVRRDPSDAPT